MNPSAAPLRKTVLVLGDITVSVVALVIAPIIRHRGIPEPFIVELYVFAAPFLIFLWLSGFIIFGLYDLKLVKNEPTSFERLAKAQAFNFALTVALFYFIPELRLRLFLTLVIIFAVLTVFLSLWRALYNAVLARRFKERILFLGINSEVAEVTRFLAENPQLGFRPAVYLKNGDDQSSENEFAFAGGPILEFKNNLGTVISEYDIDRVVIAPEIKKNRALSRMLTDIIPLGTGITDLPRFYEGVKGKVPVSLISESWFVENLAGMKRPKYEMAKRFLDLTLAFIFGVAGLVLLPFIALVILLSTPKDLFNHREKRAREGDGLIFFRQKRMGRNGQVFDFLKFRSQVLGAEKMGGAKDMSGDSRAYAAGSFLRKAYLDELPQLWNVIRGEMSFVGPRPERPEFVSQLEKQIPFYRMRELVLPGITGWAQISMADDASVEDAPEKMQYDLYYIKNRSIALDVAILLKTALKLLQRSGR
ncbi:MAG: sugar transferase [Candidatus Sungbacteria bacterium]|nr:sugar transferase [Candidatus Sungbacteria bacterium]